PLVHARDAALGKVAAIGTVNPRPGGLVNSIVQGWKKFVARVLDWHVREQVEFNRNIVTCIDAAIEAITENNRATSQVASQLGGRLESAIALAEELKDIRSHWADWHAEWERKLQQNEVQLLRAVADLQGHFQHRVNVLDSGYRDQLKMQHGAFTAALDVKANEIQQRLWADLERIRLEYEGLIHSELKTIRQRSAAGLLARAPDVAAAPAASSELQFDYGRFAERFRGAEEYVRAGQQFYRPYFAGRTEVLDIG